MAKSTLYCEKPGHDVCPHIDTFETHVLIRALHSLGKHFRGVHAAWGERQSMLNRQEGPFLTSVVPSSVCNTCPFRLPHTGGHTDFKHS